MPRIVQFEEDNPTDIFDQLEKQAARDRLIRQQSAKAASDRDLQRQRIEQSKAYNKWLMGRDDARAAEAEKARKHASKSAKQLERFRSKKTRETTRLRVGHGVEVQEGDNRKYKTLFNAAQASNKEMLKEIERQSNVLYQLKNLDGKPIFVKGKPDKEINWGGVKDFDTFLDANPSMNADASTHSDAMEAIDIRMLAIKKIDDNKTKMGTYQPYGAQVDNDGNWTFVEQHDLRDFYQKEWPEGGGGRKSRRGKKRDDSERDDSVNLPPNISKQLDGVEVRQGPTALGPPETVAVEAGPSPMDAYTEQYEAGARDEDPAFGPDRATALRNRFRNIINLPDLEPETRYTGPALAPTQTGTGVYEPVMTSPDAIGPTMLPVMRTVPDDVVLSGGAEGYEEPSDLEGTLQQLGIPLGSVISSAARAPTYQGPEEVVVTDEELPWDAVHPAGPLEGQPYHYEPSTEYPPGLTPQQGYDVPLEQEGVIDPTVSQAPPPQAAYPWPELPPRGLNMADDYARSGAFSVAGDPERRESYERLFGLSDRRRALGPYLPEANLEANFRWEMDPREQERQPEQPEAAVYENDFWPAIQGQPQTVAPAELPAEMSLASPEALPLSPEQEVELETAKRRAARTAINLQALEGLNEEREHWADYAKATEARELATWVLSYIDAVTGVGGLGKLVLKKFGWAFVKQLSGKSAAEITEIVAQRTATEVGARRATREATEGVLKPMSPWSRPTPADAALRARQQAAQTFNPGATPSLQGLQQNARRGMHGQFSPTPGMEAAPIPILPRPPVPVP